jgi:hypothetical protein
MRTHNWIGGQKMKDLTGLQFGKLTVLSYEGRIPTNMDKNHKTFAIWRCKCDCGRTIIKTGRALLHDKTKSCGCLQKEAGSLNGRKRIKPSTFLLRYLKVYKYTAKKKNIGFNLTLDDFKTLVNQNCYLCGHKPEPKSLCRAKYYNNEILFNGIDRLDSTKGYILDNCKPCCSICNKLKNNLTINVFMEQIEKIFKFKYRKDKDE